MLVRKDKAFIIFRFIVAIYPAISEKQVREMIDGQVKK